MSKLKIKKFLDITRLFKYIKLKLYRHPALPEELAMSIALGVFIGIMPTFTLASILSILAAGAFRIPKLPCFLGTLIANPYTTPFFLTLSYKAGNFIMSRDFAASIADYGFTILRNEGLRTTILRMYRFFTPLLIGGLIIALPVSVITYYFTLASIKGFHLARQHRKNRKKN